ncbi:MAG: hypothetical protein PHH11_04755 [Methylomonas sp.]|nr:hypothetical protein [Methylomonas sp.]
MALFSWPLVSFYLYQRLPLAKATLWSILGAYLLLPKGTEVDLPMVPPFDKVTVPNLTAFLICRFVLGRRVPLLPAVPAAKVLMLLYIISPFVTALLNPDPVVTGQTFIEGMKIYDAMAIVIRQQLFILPFLLGLRFFRSAKDMESILLVLILAGLWYSLPMLFEIRMSPQLHNWIYGYFPHSFQQQIRDGGFRPMVFIGHGLWVAFFIMTTLLAALTFHRIRRPSIRQLSNGMVIFYLAVVLLLCKSMASFVYAVIGAILISFIRPIFQARIALIMVLIAMTYPISKGLDWFPTQTIIDLAAEVSEERAKSFAMRAHNEEMLLDKANLRPWFGWGTWGRNRIYDPVLGRDISVTDGRWIQVIGMFGWVGLIAEFGLLVLAVRNSSKALRFLQSHRDATVMASVTLLLGMNVLDLLPNNTMTPWTWLLAGAVMGRAEQIRMDRAVGVRQSNIVSNKS